MIKKPFVNFFALSILTIPFAVAMPALAAAPNWNVSGTWGVTFVGTYGETGSYPYSVTLTQAGTSIIGTGVGASTPDITITGGSVIGSTINFTGNYGSAWNGTFSVTGTIAPGGTMSGTWTQTPTGGTVEYGGTWTATSVCTPISGATSPGYESGVTVNNAGVVASTGQSISGVLAETGCDVGVYVGPNITGVAISATVNNAKYVGIYVDGGKANVINSMVSNAGVSKSGMGWGIEYVTNGETGASGTVTNTNVSSYQKSGILIFGSGSTATISGDTVSGLGPIPFVAQNGIEVDNGAAAIVKNNQVSGNSYNGTLECPGENYLWPAQCYMSGGVLLYDAAPTVTVSNNTVSSNDVGIWSVYDAEPLYVQAPVVVNNNNIQKNYGYGLVFDGVNGTSTNNSFTSNPVGLLVTDELATSTVVSLNDQFLNNDVSSEALDAGDGFVENLVVETSAWSFHFPLSGSHGPHSPGR